MPAAGLLMPFEVLDVPFMLLGGRPRLEGSEVPTFPGFGVLLARVQSKLPRFKFANHEHPLKIFSSR